MTIPVRTIQQGNFSGVREPLQVVIRAPAEWESLWKRHTSIQSPPSPAPVVDFVTEMVVGVFLGEKSRGGYEVEIKNAELKDSVLYVYYVEKSPSPGGATIQALTQPFHIVKLPRNDARVVFLTLPL
jgi:protease stability complex PrcB-like protein